MSTNCGETEREAREHNIENWEETHEARLGASDIVISSFMWDTPEPGDFMRYWPAPLNRGDFRVNGLSLSVFFGLGALYPDPVEAYRQRDRDWPEVTTPTFSLDAGERKRFQLGPRIDSSRAPGIYMVNAIVWRTLTYNDPSTVVARMHIKFEVKAS